MSPRPPGFRVTVLQGAAWSGLEKWVGRLSSLLVFVVLSRLLGPEDIGLVALATVFTSFLAIFVDQGFSKALIQRPTIEDRDLDTAFWTSLVIGVGLAAAGVATAPLAAELLDQPELTGVLRWLCPLFVLGALGGTPSAALQREFRFRTLAIRRLISSVAGGVVGVGMALGGLGVWSLVGQILVQAGVSVVVLWTVSSWRPRLQFSWRVFLELLGFGVHVTGIETLSFAGRNGDNLLVGAVLGPVALGYYAVGYRILLVLLELFTGTLTSITMPTFSRLTDDPPALRRAFLAAIRLSNAVALPAFLGVGVLAPDLIAALFGARWLPSAAVMQALTVVAVVQASTYFDRGLLLALGQARLEFRLTLVATIGNLAAFAVAVRFGIVWVAVAFALRNLLFWPVRIRALHRAAGIRPSAYVRQWIPILGAATLMGAAMLVVRVPLADAEPILVVATATVTGTVTYLVALRLLAPQVPAEVLAALGDATGLRLRLPGRRQPGAAPRPPTRAASSRAPRARGTRRGRPNDQRQRQRR